MTRFTTFFLSIALLLCVTICQGQESDNTTDAFNPFTVGELTATFDKQMKAMSAKNICHVGEYLHPQHPSREAQLSLVAAIFKWDLKLQQSVVKMEVQELGDDPKRLRLMLVEEFGLAAPPLLAGTGEFARVKLTVRSLKVGGSQPFAPNDNTSVELLLKMKDGRWTSFASRAAGMKLLAAPGGQELEFDGEQVERLIDDNVPKLIDEGAKTRRERLEELRKIPNEEERHKAILKELRNDPEIRGLMDETKESIKEHIQIDAEGIIDEAIKPAVEQLEKKSKKRKNKKAKAPKGCPPMPKPPVSISKLLIPADLFGL